MPPTESSRKKSGASTKDGEDTPSSGRSGSWVSIKSGLAMHRTKTTCINWVVLLVQLLKSSKFS